MSWDLLLDPETNDLVFGQTNDIMGVMDVNLVMQRIRLRCMIPRGTFQDDTDGTLGSEIPFMNGTVRGTDSEVIAAVQAALSPMTDILIENITVVTLDEAGAVSDGSDQTQPGKKLIGISWSLASAEGEPADESTPDSPVFQTNIRVTV